MTDSRKGGSIIIFDYEGAEVKRYKLTNAWPKSLEIGSLKAGDTLSDGEADPHLRSDRSGLMAMRRGTVIIPEPKQAPVGSPAGADETRSADQGQRLVTEFSFLLPRGYVDGSGRVHRDGVMRLATARDGLILLRT